MRKPAAIAILMILISAGCTYETREPVFGNKDTVFSAKKKPEEVSLPAFAASKTTDIHFSAKYCRECHLDTPRKGSSPQLRYGGDYKLLCRCHYSITQNYIHPVDIVPSDQLKARIPADLPLQAGKVTCNTCHDIVAQCRDNPSDRILLEDNKFLRGAPFANRTSLCFRCHDIEQYQRYNPHRQLNAAKEIMTEKCLYCHAEIPDVKKTTYEDVKLIANLEVLCTRCHFKEPKQFFHAKHLRKPSKEVAVSIKKMEVEYGIILPLSEEGKITCATCHNPHEKGVIPDKRAGATGAGEKKRWRLVDNMCIKCHPMRELIVPEDFVPPQS